LRALALIGCQYWNDVEDPADRKCIVTRVLYNSEEFYKKLSKPQMEELVSLVVKLNTHKEIEKTALESSHLFSHLKKLDLAEWNKYNRLL
jgi:hypothetical protein